MSVETATKSLKTREVKGEERADMLHCLVMCYKYNPRAIAARVPYSLLHKPQIKRRIGTWPWVIGDFDFLMECELGPGEAIERGDVDRDGNVLAVLIREG